MFRICGAELDSVIPLIASFRGELGLPFDPETFVPKQKELMAQALSFMFVTMREDKVAGMIAFQIAEDLLSDLIFAVEQAWYVSESYRGGSDALRLYNAYEKFAKEQEAKKITMVHLYQGNEDGMEKFLTKKGYRKLETQWIKDI